ncbi:MAG: TolC family protein [Opitutaceae bacterium]|nr:TolC family protein [Opitutaceae bacterium]
MAFAIVVLAGCRGISTANERRSTQQLQNLTSAYRPGDHRATLPTLDASASLSAFLTYAMLNQPRVEAAYYEYAAAVDRITLERSLPDPRLSLELDIQEVVTTVMPGLMSDLPWMRKLRLRADVASAESEAKYFAFEMAVLQAALDVKRPYYELYFLTDRLRVNGETLALLEQLEQIARTQVEAGKASLQDVLRAQIDQERLKTEIANLHDSRNPLLAKFKAALGLSSDEPSPPIPTQFETTPLDLTSEELFAAALKNNPRLKAMEAEIRMAETGIRLARTSKLPDFNAGIEVDAKASPVMVRPTLAITLPIWRDKIAAEISSAQGLRRAAEARLSAEQIQLAVEFADKSFLYREATRTINLLIDSLLPKARQAFQVARSGYSAGKADFINVQEAQRTLLEFELAAVDARIRRELVLAEVSLLIAGITPSDAPILTPTRQLKPGASSHSRVN